MDTLPKLVKLIHTTMGLELLSVTVNPYELSNQIVHLFLYQKTSERLMKSST